MEEKAVSPLRDAERIKVEGNLDSPIAFLLQKFITDGYVLNQAYSYLFLFLFFGPASILKC